MKLKTLLRGNDVLNWTNPESKLDHFLERAGMEIVTSFSNNPDVVVFLNWGRKSRQDLKNAQLVGAKTLLVMTEPSVVIPQHRNSRLLSDFSNLLQIGRPWANRVVPYPQAWNTDFFHETSRQDAVVAITGNKVSFIRGELYSLRLSAYQELNNIQLFGSGWDMSRREKASQVVRHLAGAIIAGERITLNGLNQLDRKSWPTAYSVRNKFETMSKYKYSLVIENSAEYVSEKLGDAIMAGTVPIYVGADPVPLGIPRELFVPCSPNLKAVMDGFITASELDYDAWRQSAWNWLSDPKNRDARSSVSINQTIAGELMRLSVDDRN